MAKEYKFGFVIEGDYKSAVTALQKTQAELDRLEKTTDKTKKTQDTWSEATQSFEKKLGSMRSMVVGLAGALGATLSVNYFAGIIKQSIDAQDELAKMSQRTGVAVEQLAGLQHAASLSGASIETVEKGLKTVSQQLMDADRGLKSAQENFAALGISVTDSTGALRSADSVMIEVADQFARMKDGTEKTALATKLFGKAGLELIPMLNEGSAGIAAMVREGRMLNPVTEQSAAMAEQFNDNLDRMKSIGGQVATMIANSALPRMAQWTQSFWDLYSATDEFVTKQDELLENIGRMTEQELVRESVALNNSIEQTRQRRLELERLTKQFGTQEAEIRRLREEEERLAGLQANLIAQLRKVQDGYEPVIDLTYEQERAAKASADALRDLNAVYARAGSTIALTAEQYVQMMGVTDQVTTRKTKLSAATQGVSYNMDALALAVEQTGRKSKTVSEAMVRDWQNARQSSGEFFADLVQNGGSAIDSLLKMWERAALQMAGSKLFDMGASLLGINIPGGSGSSAGSLFSTAISAAGSKVLPGLFGAGAGASAGAGVAAAGAADAAIAAYSGGAATGGGSALGAIGAGIGKVGAGISNALAAVPGWGWALAGGAALAALLAKDSTPSSNAGFLMKDVPGASADRKFDVPAFASGFDPVGFARRDSQANALQIIDTFRSYDAALTEMARSVGMSVNYDWKTFAGMGSDETGRGSGVFVGSASEDGKLNSSSINAQVDQYVRLWIEGLGSQLSANAKSSILGAGDADAMLAKAAELISGVHGSHRAGLAYVPFDGYRAELHRGESVLDASEARAWRSGDPALRQAIDRLTSAIAGMNVRGGDHGLQTAARDLQSAARHLSRTPMSAEVNG